MGISVRLEAMRTEKCQTRFQPLQPYMDEKPMGDHTWPWKQMLIFSLGGHNKRMRQRAPSTSLSSDSARHWGALVKGDLGSG
jgi:hypothetical protein